MGQKWPKNPQNYVYLRPNETTKRGVSVRARVRRGEMAKREYERKFYINFIPIPPSWGGRQLWRVNQKNRRRDLRSHQTLHRIAPCALPPLTSPLHWLFQIQCSVQSWAQCTTGGSLVHYSQGVRISNFQRFFTKPPPPPCISSFFLFIIAAPSVGEKIGNWVLDFCPHPLLPNFAGNGNFHILAEIENIKSSRGEYCLTASESICN